MPLHACYDFCWPNDLSAFTKAKYPGEELRADDHIRSDGEVVRVVRNDKDILPQPVQNGADQMVFKPEDHMFLRSSEHAKGFPGLDRHVQRLVGIQTVPVLIQDRDLLHLIHAVVLDHGSI